MEGASPDIDLLAASLRADTSDVGAFVEGLASKLEDVLPGRVKIQRGRRGLFGPKVVQSISLDAGDQRLELVRQAGERIEMCCARLSGGIVLKRETLESDAWLSALGTAMTIEARHSEQTRRALERLLVD